MIKVIRFGFIVTSVFVLLLTVTSCGTKERDASSITNVKLSVMAGDTVILNDVDVAVKGDSPTVIDAIRQAFEEDDGLPEIRFDRKDDPLTVLDIGEFLDNAERFWEFRLNDTPFSKTKGMAGNCRISEGDRIYFEYSTIAESE